MGKNMMTRESFKEYIRNEIIEMLSPKDAKEIANNLGIAAKAAKDIENVFGENEDNTQPSITITIPENTHYANFAEAVAKALKEEYGQHNYISFIDELLKKLGLDNN